MANIITAVVRDSSGQIVAYADYRNDGSMPEHISKLAAKPGNTVSTTERKQSKKQDSALAEELGQRREQTNVSNQRLAAQQEEEIKKYEKYSTMAERSGKQNVGQRVPEQKIAEDSYKNLQKIQQNITTNNELLDSFSESRISSKGKKDNVGKAAADAAAYTNRNADVQAYAYDSGLQIVDEKGGKVDTSQPRGMTREQAQEYNKNLIAIQIPYIIETRKAEKAAQMGTPQTESSTPQSTPTPVIATPVTNRTGSGTPTDPYKSKQPDRNLVSPYLQATYWTAPGTEKTFTTLSDADAYLRQSQKTESSYIGFSPEGKAVQGPPQPQWIVDNLNPITKERFPNKTFKTEAEAIAYQKKFGKEETVVLPVGTLQYQYGQTPTDPFKSMIEKAANRSGEIQNENMKKGFLGQIANAPLEAGKSVLSFGATVINLSEQYVDPYIEKTLNLKTPVKTAPIYLKEDTASMTQLSYDTKYTPQQNVKRWAGLQAEYIEKKGLPAYLVGGLENYYLVKGGVGAVKMGASLIPKVGGVIAKPLLPRIGGAAKSAAIQGAPNKIFKGESKFASPTKNWDAIEKVSPVGFRKTVKPSLPTTIKKGTEPVPNPYGKERKIPYAVRQGVNKLSDYVKSIPDKIPPRPQTPNVLLRAGVLASRVIDAEQVGVRKAKDSFNKWNEAGRVESPIPQGTKIKNTRLERMRNLMWPETVETPKATSTSPPIGYKAKLSGEMYLKNTKQNVKENVKVLSEGSKDVISKITTPIKKDQKTPNRSINNIHLGKKTQLPVLEGMTAPEGLVKFVRKADVSALALKQKAKTKITQAKQDFNKMRDMFYPEPEKKVVIPIKTKQELKNMTREDKGFTQDFVSRQKIKDSPHDFVRKLREEYRTTPKRDYAITPKTHQDYLKGETLVDKIQSSSKTQVKARRETNVDLPERNVIPRLKYTETKLIDKILSGLEKPKDFSGEYMPRSKGKSKPNRNIFIEDKADKISDFFSKSKPRPDLKKEFPKETGSVPSLRPSYFETKTIQSKARTLDLKTEEKLLAKKQRDTPIEKLKGDESKGISGFVKEGEKRKSFVDRLRSEKKQELPERNISIFKVPYEETKLDKMLADLGKKKKTYYKKTDTTNETFTQSRPKIIRDEDKGITNKNQILLKPELKKKLETKLETPIPRPQEEISGSSAPMKGEKTTPLIIPPLPKEERRKKPEVQSAYSSYEVPLHSDRPKISARSMVGSSLSLGTRSVLSSRINTSQVQPQKISSDIKLSQSSKSITAQKSKLFEAQKLSVAQKQKPKQIVKEQYKMPSPQVPKPKQTSIFKQTIKPIQKLRQPYPVRPPKIRMIIVPPPPPDSKTTKKKIKGKKNQDFLGNTRLDKIEGFFKRSDIITGDKASAKQLGKDIRFKEGKNKGLGFSGKKLRI